MTPDQVMERVFKGIEDMKAGRVTPLEFIDREFNWEDIRRELAWNSTPTVKQ